MKQVIATNITSHPTSGVGYANFPITSQSATNSTYRTAPWSVAGVFRNWTIELDTAPGTGSTRIFTLFKNGVATALTVSISDAETTGNDTTHEVAAAPGDWFVTKIEPAGNTPASVATSFHTVEFEGTATAESGYAVCHMPSTTDVRYLAPLGGEWWRASAVAGAESVIAAAGTFTRMDVSSAYYYPGTGDSWTLVLILNDVVQDGTGGTVNTQVVLTGTGDANKRGYATFSLAVSAGDILTIRCTPSGTPTPSYLGISLCFEATTAGQSLLGANCEAAVVVGTSYNYPSNATALTWTATETPTKCLHGGVTQFTVNGLRVHLSTGPGAVGSGDGYRFVLRKNFATPEGAPTVTISETAVDGVNVSAGVTIAAGDVWCISCTALNTPANKPYACYGWFQSEWVPPEPPVVPVWVDIPNFVELEMAKSTFPGGHCRVLVYLWTDTPGATIQARLQNVTDNTTVGTSPVVVATTPTYAGFFAQLEGTVHTLPGDVVDLKYYRLQVTTDTPAAALFAHGPGLVY